VNKCEFLEELERRDAAQDLEGVVALANAHVGDILPDCTDDEAATIEAITSYAARLVPDPTVGMPEREAPLRAAA
jgi:hypothetical protein